MGILPLEDLLDLLRDVSSVASESGSELSCLLFDAGSSTGDVPFTSVPDFLFLDLDIIATLGLEFSAFLVELSNESK